MVYGLRISNKGTPNHDSISKFSSIKYTQKVHKTYNIRVCLNAKPNPYAKKVNDQSKCK